MGKDPFRLPSFDMSLLYAGAAATMCWYFLSKSSPATRAQMLSIFMAVQGGTRRPGHPEAAEPHRTQFDPHQLGRSEVICELARPKQN